MGIQLFHLMSQTPDRVKSSDGEGSLSDGEKKFVWCLRDKSKPGINIKLKSVPTTGDSASDWEVGLYNVYWDGEKFVEDDEPRSKYAHENAQDAISCAEQEIKNISKKDEEFSHCINFLGN